MMESTVNYKNIAILRTYDSISDLIPEFAGFLSERIKESKDKKKDFRIALSGGSTPTALYKYFAENPTMLPSLSHVHFYWGDERCVPPESAESNYGIAFKEFLGHFDIPSGNIHRIKGEIQPEESSKEYSKILEFLPKSKSLPSFDLVILGLGNDGHTASIFPDRLDLIESHDFAAVVRHPESGQHRISLTGPVLNNSKEIVFLVTGSSKAKIADHIFHNKPAAKTYPAFFIRPDSGKLFWFCDKAVIS